MHKVENFCQIVGKKRGVLRDDMWVVKLFYFREWDGVFFYAPVVDSGVGESLLAQLLLPGPSKDAVESGA